MPNFLAREPRLNWSCVHLHGALGVDVGSGARAARSLCSLATWAERRQHELRPWGRRGVGPAEVATHEREKKKIV
jgi:hypothetical protein